MLKYQVAYLACFALMLSNSIAWSQQNQAGNPNQNSHQPPQLDATVTEIKTQGRTQILVVANEEGQTLEIPLSRVAVDIKASGDTGFVREGAYIGAVGTVSNEMMFIRAVNVLLPAKGQKLPRGKVGKAPRQAGASVNSYQVAGTIQAIKPNPDYPDYTMLAIDAQGKYPTLNLEKTYRVNVVSMDKTMLAVGMKVVLDGRFNRGKFLTSKITANRAEPFKSEEFYGAAEEDGKPSKE